MGYAQRTTVSVEKHLAPYLAESYRGGKMPLLPESGGPSR